jgi:hypothetical protein
MTKASDNDFPSVLLTEQSSAPANPAAGKQRTYIRTSDHALVTVNSSGTVTPVGTAASGSITASGYTQNTAKLLGRTTASSGAIEEITVGSGLTLSAGSLTGSGGSDLVQVASGAGSVTIPGIAVPDRVPASPNAKDDEFDALSGWSTLGTLDTSNVTDYKSHYHIKRTSSAANVDGIYKAGPSVPYTVTAKLAATNIDNGSPGHRSVGILLADTTPTALLLIEYNFASGGNFSVSARKWTNRTTFSSSLNDTSPWTASVQAVTPMPLYLRALVTSSTSVTVSYSLDGFIFHTTATVNPGITFVNVGISVSDPVDSGGNTVEGIFDWIRFV